LPKIFLKIAGITVCIESRQSPQKEDPADIYLNRFVLKNKPRKADINIGLKVTPRYRQFERREFFISQQQAQGQKSVNGPGEQRLECGLNWRIGGSGRKILIEGGSANKYQLLIDKKLTCGELLVINKTGAWVLKDIIRGFLQVLLIYYLAKKHQGVVFHAAGIADSGNGYLFAGKSGSGKSTISRIWFKGKGAGVLSDDRVIIKKEKHGFYMFPTPWNSGYPAYLINQKRLGKIKLAKLFFIHHRKTNLAKALSPAKAAAYFSQAIFFSFWDKECLDATFDFLEEIINNKPCYRLGFKNNRKIINYINHLQ